MFRLEGANALVTGATGGIGQAIVKVLHQAGANIVASGTNAAKLSALQLEFSERLTTLQCNLFDRIETANLVELAEKAVGDISIVICNAGICRDNLSMRMKDSEWDEVIEVNLSAVFRINRAAILKMMRRRYGRIINISSIVGFTGNMGQANYTATKAALIGMSKSLALETASRGITVNCVAPGFIKSPMTDGLSEALITNLLTKVPMGTMGESVDIANAVLFLAAKESSYITGSTIHVNGGMFMS